MLYLCQCVLLLAKLLITEIHMKSTAVYICLLCIYHEFTLHSLIWVFDVGKFSGP